MAEGNPARWVDRSDFNVSTLARLDGRPQIELRAISVGRRSLWFPKPNHIVSGNLTAPGGVCCSLLATAAIEEASMNFLCGAF